jgi:hypothetical protein
MGTWALNSTEAFTQEANFQQDFNGDGLIGAPYTTVEAFGTTKLVKDGTNNLYAQVDSATPVGIKNGGTQIYQGIYSGWETLAAETVAGVNQVLWKNIPGNYLHLWTLDSNWNWISSMGTWGLNSTEAFTQEANFQQDFNSDGLIGAPSPAAFPGAEGFGASATGGRGGQVIYVTTTAASGPGSLQWAIDQPGPKYILFKVSGLIDARIHLRNGDTTIAGHTSPGGITIRGFVTDETPYQDQAVRAPSDFAENWILQHIRIRPGLNGPSDDGLRLRYTRNAIVDHVSVGNATDEAVEISYSNNITIQNSMLAETLGGHSFYGGMLINYSNPAHGFALDNLSIHHNLFNRIEGRLPEASRESLAAAGSTMNLEMSSNLYWDPRFFIALGPNTGQLTDGNGNPYPIYYRLNAVNNYFRTGSSFPYGMWDDQILRERSASDNQLYVQGNRMSLYPNRRDYELFYCCNDYAGETNPDPTSRQAQDRSTRHPFPTISYTPALDLPTALPNRVGAWPRDPMDTRLLQPVRENRIDPANPSINPAGDSLLAPYPGTAPPAPVDTDNDGMPDLWEIARGLNPGVANHNGTNLSTLGYTNLEVYLHELAASLVPQG